LDDLKERREYSHLKEEALDRIMWRARFGGGFGPVVRQTTKWMNEYICHVYMITNYCIKISENLGYTMNALPHKVMATHNFQYRVFKKGHTHCRQFPAILHFRSRLYFNQFPIFSLGNVCWVCRCYRGDKTGFCFSSYPKEY
jgi:hypothetical protein